MILSKYYLVLNFSESAVEMICLYLLKESPALRARFLFSVIKFTFTT